MTDAETHAQRAFKKDAYCKVFDKINTQLAISAIPLNTHNSNKIALLAFIKNAEEMISVCEKFGDASRQCEVLLWLSQFLSLSMQKNSSAEYQKICGVVAEKSYLQGREISQILGNVILFPQSYVAVNSSRAGSSEAARL